MVAYILSVPVRRVTEKVEEYWDNGGSWTSWIFTYVKRRRAQRLNLIQSVENLRCGKSTSQLINLEMAPIHSIGPLSLLFGF